MTRQQPRAAAPDTAFGLAMPRITSEDELRDCIPFLLGFYPERSLVLIGLDGADLLRVTARIDAPTSAEEARAVLGQVGRVLVRSGVTHVLAVYADDVDPCPGEEADVRLTSHLIASRHLADVRDLEPVFIDELQQYGLAAVFCWPTPSQLLRGRVITPPASVLPVLANGRTAARSRDELDAVLAPLAGARRRAVADALEGMRAARHDSQGLADVVLAVLRRRSRARRAGRPAIELSGPEVAACAVAVSEPSVRDGVLTALAADRELICDDVWIPVITLAPPELIAAPAVLLGVGAYLRGDGAFAACAFDRALRADPTGRLPALLLRALNEGIRPDQLGDFLIDLEPDPDTSGH